MQTLEIREYVERRGWTVVSSIGAASALLTKWATEVESEQKP
jgi:hypothetical protein